MATNNSESFAIRSMDASIDSGSGFNPRTEFDQLRTKIPFFLPGRLERATAETVKNAMLIRAGLFVMAHGLLLAAVMAGTLVS